jgi:hypothetical protein
LKGVLCLKNHQPFQIHLLVLSTLVRWIPVRALVLKQQNSAWRLSFVDFRPRDLTVEQHPRVVQEPFLKSMKPQTLITLCEKKFSDLM